MINNFILKKFGYLNTYIFVDIELQRSTTCCYSAQFKKFSVMSSVTFTL